MVQGLPRVSVMILAMAALFLRQWALTPKRTVVDASLHPTSAPFRVALNPEIISKQELDTRALEMAFGKGSEAMSRPVRLWLSQIGMAIAAREVALEQNGSVRFTDVSLGFLGEAKVLHGTEGVFVVDRPILEIGQLTNRDVMSVELQSNNGAVVLTRRTGKGTTSAMSTKDVLMKSRPSSSPVPPKMEMSNSEEREIELTNDLTQLKTFLAINRPFDFRFKFSLDSQVPLADLLPIMPRMSSKASVPLNDDLTEVAEIAFGEPMAKDVEKHQAIEAIAHVIAKINHLNSKKPDGFMVALIENRADLSGLAFLLGDDCRSSEEQARAFPQIAAGVHRVLLKTRGSGDGTNPIDFGEVTLPAKLSRPGASPEPRASPETVHRALVAALMQILMPESAHVRVNLARYLATIPHIDARKALARLVIFSPEDTVRAAAIEGLKLSQERDYTDILMQGFDYPLPVVANRSAEALVKLDRKDVLADLIDVLERPDPRLPVAKERDGKEVLTVRELVKVNHHRNCLLCHAPGNTLGPSTAVLKVAVPSPAQPLPKSTRYYQTTPPTSDILVRLDMTYLRQDFSLMMPVAEAHPWPEMQRFDFLVRTRQVTPAEAQAFESGPRADEPGQLLVYHRAARYALRELSGRDAEATPQAWRKVLNIAKRS